MTLDMNSYFEQSAAAGFYAQNEQAAAAYRFPIGLTVSPYGSSTPTAAHQATSALSRSDPPGTAYENMSVSSVAGKLNDSNPSYKDCSNSSFNSGVSSGVKIENNSSTTDRSQYLVQNSNKDHSTTPALGSWPQVASSLGMRTPDRYPDPMRAAWSHGSLNNAGMTNMHSHQIYPWMAIAGVVLY